MTIQEALVQILKADARVTAITSALYPQEAYADDVPPFALYVTSGETQTASVSGFVNHYTTEFRFDCYGAPPAYSSAHALARAIDSALKAFFRGKVTSPADGSSLTIQCVLDSGGDDNLDPPIDGQEKGFDYVAKSYTVVHNLN